MVDVCRPHRFRGLEPRGLLEPLVRDEVDHLGDDLGRECRRCACVGSGEVARDVPQDVLRDVERLGREAARVIPNTPKLDLNDLLMGGRLA